MDTTTKYLRLNPDGSTELVIEQRSTRIITDTIAKQFATGVTMSLQEAFLIPFRASTREVSIICTASDRYLVTRLPGIRLNTNFVLQGEHIVPFFFHPDDTAGRESTPKASVEAIFPPGMSVVFACRIQGWKNDSNYSSHRDQTCYLIAYSADKRAWRLPLPNIFEDGAMCMGSFNGSGSTAAEAFGKAIAQLDASEWNSDLMQGRQEMAQKLFRFDPKDNQNVPFEGDWTALCEKIATPVTALIGGQL